MTKSHSRPYCSNDNPFSEAQFKTLKYRPEFPDRFFTLKEAEGFCPGFFAWYNNEHHHSGLGYLTPAMVHFGHTDQVLCARRAVLKAAYEQHPERFVRKLPEPQAPPVAVYINPPAPRAEPRPEPTAAPAATPLDTAVKSNGRDSADAETASCTETPVIEA